MQSKLNNSTFPGHSRKLHIISSFYDLIAMKVPEFDKIAFKIVTYWYYSFFWNPKWDELKEPF